ncbi:MULTISPECIES: heavy metal translocating P-type ATPase [Oceanobacillus]|uniref:Cadmium-translocating P-type ATPase n=1 Tax=Oceanobacillus profundus TaxID=372463 RepID=A0A417YA48_9BACI|nr:heavy metal translocating P-type ATPase [Oceanobacillus profundus]MBR3118030.1 cadmium-translocating P-type ATPase [Oceanobacillus sp.]MCM3400300.1 cadmium-translocating P-type ATPase [Oceanobacillus profundus]PAE27478.1 heavy metal translocating P-type ATPase [Paenibacillus sp. 7884-2]RHW29549.1 cadmium-translocating P-type ATPase [Oceanobacillus profundus]
MSTDTLEMKRTTWKTPISKLKTVAIYEHHELIAALISGLLLLLAWIFKDQLTSVLWFTLHGFAFAIGGYAKAKEGITETIQTKKLNVEILMILAAIGAITIGYWTEAAILIFIFALSGALETYSMNKSNRAISSLMELQPEEALLLQDKRETTIPVSQLKIGDTILVRAGERIPADGVIVKGASTIDESTITGESLPIYRQNQHDVYAGTVALDGTLTIKITTKPNETLFQKIIQLVQSAQEEKSTSQLFIEKFESTYVYGVLAIVAIMMFLPYLLFNWTLSDSIYRAMVLLVVASPCALVASISPATLSAISNAARKGILFKGGVHLENLSNIQAIALDKTGTLTKGKPAVTNVYMDEAVNEKEILSIIGAIEKESTHPIAKSITAYCLDKAGVLAPTFEIKHLKNISGKGIIATVGNNEWRIGKADFVGKELTVAFQQQYADKQSTAEKTSTFIQINERIIGMFILKDTTRESAKEAIHNLKSNGIETIMLTGDNELTAKAVAEEVGINQYKANCLPQDKVEYVKSFRKQYKTVAMVGDGINDAPALANANVSIAMGEGTDIALDTADMVLMKNDLTKITNAIQVSKRMNRVIKQNIIFSLTIILLLVLTNYFQIIDLPLGVIGHEGSTILVILNSLRLLK